MNLRQITLCFLFLVLTNSSAANDRQVEKAGQHSLTFSVIVTARSGGAQEAMMVNGGGWLKQRKLVHNAVLVRHPKGDFLWDSGIGTDISAQLEAFSFWEKMLFKLEQIEPAIHQFDKHGYAPESLMAIIPSHMHWDHASALEDFSGTPVWVQASELEAAHQGLAPAFVQSQFDSESLVWKTISLEGKTFLGFDKSLDIYGDGSAILVNLAGHTQGQLGLVLTIPEKGRYFFIGDTTWTLEGIKRNQGRPKLINWLADVDDNIEKNASVIEQIHKLSLNQPELVIVPAHDENVTARLPVYPEFL